MVSDYRGLNRIKVEVVNLLSLIQETLDQMTEARHFSKFDLVGVHHHL